MELSGLSLRLVFKWYEICCELGLFHACETINAASWDAVGFFFKASLSQKAQYLYHKQMLNSYH